jgi:hypothetical protein
MRGGGLGSRPATRAVAALVLAASALAARAEEPAGSVASRFYAGVEVASVKLDDGYGGIDFSDSTFGLGAYTGYWVKDHLAVELAYDWTDAIDLHDLAGSGVVRFDITSKRHTLALSVLREISLRDLLDLRRDWRLFGMLGVYDTNVERTVTDLRSNAQIAAGDSGSGALVAAGVLYTVGRVELRGYLRGWGDAKEIGAGVQFRF